MQAVSASVGIDRQDPPIVQQPLPGAASQPPWQTARHPGSQAGVMLRVANLSWSRRKNENIKDIKHIGVRGA